LKVGVPLDWRIVLAVGIVMLAGVAKGITGLGAPIVATPILALLYDDLPTAIAVMIAPTVLTDVMLLAWYLPHYRESVRLIPFVLFGLAGIVFGTQLLVSIDEAILRTILGAVITVFVLTSWFNRLPVLSKPTARIAGLPIGFIAGALQGSVGASGPLITMYLFSLGMSREVFLFAINAIFLVLDTTQVVALQRAGLYTPDVVFLATLASVPLCLGVLVGFRAQKYVSDLRFRQGVLVLLTLTAIALFVRSFSQL
jgi:uncharacterized protein